MNFYVYLARDENGVVRYVGKGSGKRWRHCNRKWKTFKVEIVERFEEETQAFDCERRLIAEYGRIDKGMGTLLNQTNGGDGIRGCAPWTGKKQPEEANLKRSQTLKAKFASGEIVRPNLQGERNPFYGRTHSKKAKEANRLAHLGKPSAFKGRRHTEEAKEKNRQAHLGRTR